MTEKEKILKNICNKLKPFTKDLMDVDALEWKYYVVHDNGIMDSVVLYTKYHGSTLMSIEFTIRYGSKSKIDFSIKSSFSSEIYNISGDRMSNVFYNYSEIIKKICS